MTSTLTEATGDSGETYDDLKKTVASFSTLHPQLKFLRSEFSIEAIEDGYMNQVFRIREVDNSNDCCKRTRARSSIIIKQATSSNKLCSGLRFDVLRGKLEYLALHKFHRVLAESVPRPYLYNEPSKTLIMEDLRCHVPLSQALIGGDISVPVLCKTARYLAHLHRKTSRSFLSESDFGQLKETFGNSIQVELMRQFTFVRPFCRTDPSNSTISELVPYLSMVYNDTDTLKAVKDLELIFLEKKECLVHGDVHTGSVMVNADDVKLIDAEFAFVGAAAVDIGTYLAHLLFSHYGHKYYPKRGKENVRAIVEQGIRDSLRVYLNEFPSEEVNQVSEIAGFIGLQLVRCILGMANIADLHDLKNKSKAELACYFTGVTLLKSYTTLTTVDDLVRRLFGQ